MLMSTRSVFRIQCFVKLDVPYLAETGESAESPEPSGLFLLKQAHQRYPTLPPLGPGRPRRHEYLWGCCMSPPLASQTQIHSLLFGGETFAVLVPSSVFWFWGAQTIFELRR